MKHPIFVLITGTILLSALTTPFIYTFLSSVITPFPWPFSRVFDRVLMVWALVFLILFFREFDLGGIKRYFAGGINRPRVYEFGSGILLSLFPSLFMLTLIVGDGELMWAKRPWSHYFGKVAILIPAAVLISVIEEVFFRVVLFNRIRGYLPLVAAGAVTSAIYAAVHFITPVKSFAYGSFDPLAGFYYLEAVTERLFMPGIVPCFIGLFLVGCILAYTIHKTGSLFICIGLHAGWVMAVKMSMITTQVAPGAEFPSGIGRRYFLVAEPMTWALLLVIWAIIALGITKTTRQVPAAGLR